MKTLILVDGSPCSRKAVEYVASHPGSFQDKEGLHLLHVRFQVPYGRARAIVGMDAINAYYEEESREALAPAEKILHDKGIPYQSGFSVGDVAQQVEAYVTKHRIEQIVMGSHGHGALRNLVLGSVATKVLATTHTPVLIVR
jgi:nucleotide-binding universal stress UspA family protein